MKHTPAKTRVSGFLRLPVPRTRFDRSQSTFLQRLTTPPPPKTASGVPYYGYRFYNPELGRWMNRDPIGKRGGLNLFGFLANCPIFRIDVLGMRRYKSSAECEQAVGDCYVNYPHLRDLVDELKNRRRPHPLNPEQSVPCLIDEPYCDDNCGVNLPDSGGYYGFLPGRRSREGFHANVCTDTCNACTTLFHEIQHAASMCVNQPNSCENMLCEEVNAYYCARQCEATPGGMSSRQCAQLAAASARRSNLCIGWEMDSLVDSAMSCSARSDDCYTGRPRGPGPNWPPAVNPGIVLP